MFYTYLVCFVKGLRNSPGFLSLGGHLLVALPQCIPASLPEVHSRKDLGSAGGTSPCIKRLTCGCCFRNGSSSSTQICLSKAFSQS